ncbi:MAG: TetR/AcrR family transcriptional regulator [Acidimicrobiia bacterium]|jgi:AcrR family transcriptional regulator
MQNTVPAVADRSESLADRAASRALTERHRAYAEEVRRLIDAAYAVMRRSGETDPRVSDIVREAGLSNQAFYRHFRGKDELLLAVLDDGHRRLVGYLEHRLSRATPGAEQVREWVEGVLEQARNREAAGNTRPFAIDGARLADRFPAETARSRELLLRPLRDALVVAGGDADRDADAIYHLVMGSMNDALVHRATPSQADVDHLVDFALTGIGA